MLTRGNTLRAPACVRERTTLPCSTSLGMYTQCGLHCWIMTWLLKDVRMHRPRRLVVRKRAVPRRCSPAWPCSLASLAPRKTERRRAARSRWLDADAAARVHCRARHEFLLRGRVFASRAARLSRLRLGVLVPAARRAPARWWHLPTLGHALSRAVAP